MNTTIPPGLRTARHEFQRGLLEWLRHDAAGVIRMRRAVAAVTAREGDAAALWPVALAWLESLTDRDIAADALRLCARIDAQLRGLLRGSDAGAEELGHELRQRLSEPPAGATILSATLYDLYLTEARGHLAALEREPTPERMPSMIAAARALGEISATVGMTPIDHLALALAGALARASDVAPDQAARVLLRQAVEALRTMTETVAERRPVEKQAQLAAALERLAA